MTTAEINRDLVEYGDTVTWRTRNGGHEATARVLWAVQSGVRVEIPGRGTCEVEWERVETWAPQRPNPDLRGMPADGAPFASGPFAVYVTVNGRELVSRNYSREAALAAAHREAGNGRRVHVSLDTCG